MLVCAFLLPKSVPGMPNHFPKNMVGAQNHCPFMQYNSVDAMKLFFAVCVVGIHSSDVCPAEFPSVVMMLVKMAVPFFFMASGFLLARKLKASPAEAEAICWKAARKYLRLYLLYLGLYLPLAVAAYATNDAPFLVDVARYVSGVLFHGEPPYGWPLWYLWALILGIATIGLALRRGVGLGRLWMFSLCLFLLNAFVKDFLLVPTRYFTGLLLLLTGVMTERVAARRRSWCAGLLLLWLAVGMWHTGWTLFYPAVVGAGVFLLTLGVRLPDSPVYRRMRTVSALTYFFHMYFIFLLKVLVLYGALTLTRYEAWAVTTVAVCLFALAIDKLRARPSLRWLNALL